MKLFWHTLASLSVTLTIAMPGVVAAAEQRVEVAMRDGTKIATYIRTPIGNGPSPAVFKKGYGITKPKLHIKRFTTIQSTRRILSCP